MEWILDSTAAKLATAIIAAVVAISAYFALDILWFLTKRDVSNVNIYSVIFTKNDFGSGSNRIRFKILQYKTPLKELLRNRYLFWRVIIASFRVSLEEPVLLFGSHAYAVLSPIRGRIAEKSAGAVFKRAVGLPFKEQRYWIAMIYDRSEDKRSYILQVMVIREEDLDNFEGYLKNPPTNSDNFRLMKKIHQAFKKNKESSFFWIDIDTT